MALPDGTGAGKPACCTPISTQWPNRKMLGLDRLWISRKSASNITYSANVSRRCSARVLRTVKHAISAYSSVRPPAQCSVLCMPRCFTSPHHLHIINANCVLVPQYRDASAVMKLWVVEKRCHTSCTPCNMYGIVHAALSHCAFSTLLVDFHTLYDQLFGPSARTFLGYMLVCMIRHEILMHSYLAKSSKAKYRVE